MSNENIHFSPIHGLKNKAKSFVYLLWFIQISWALAINKNLTQLHQDNTL